MDVDPAASMRCWEVWPELGRWTYRIPALPAADWWPALETGSTAALLDMIDTRPDPLQPGRPDIDDAIGELEPGGLTAVLTDVIEQVTGRSLHASLVLAAAARDHWPSVGGAMAKAGFRWDEQPIGAALDLIHFTFVVNMDEKQREEFDRILGNETLTAGKPTQRQRARAAADFSEIAGPPPTNGVRSRSTAAPSGSERPRTQRRPRPPHPDAPSTAPMPPPG